LLVVDRRSVLAIERLVNLADLPRLVVGSFFSEQVRIPVAVVKVFVVFPIVVLVSVIICPAIVEVDSIAVEQLLAPIGGFGGFVVVVSVLLVLVAVFFFCLRIRIGGLVDLLFIAGKVVGENLFDNIPGHTE
jgi:hypothetical protein